MAIILLIGAVLLQAPSTPVTYRTRAKLIPAVLQELSAQTHLSLKADAEAGKEVVVLAVKDLPLSTLMEKLATVTSCKWVDYGDGYTLKPDLALRDKEAKHDHATRVSELRAAMKQPLDTYVRFFSQSDGDSSPVSNLNHGEPKLLCGALDVEQLADLDSDGRIVWASNDPTANQRQLGQGAVAILSDWIAKYDAAANQAKREAKHSEEDEGSGPEPIGQSVRKVIVEAEEGPDRSGEVSVEFIDGNDAVLLRVEAAYPYRLTESNQIQRDAEKEPKTPLVLTDDDRFLQTQIPHMN